MLSTADAFLILLQQAQSSTALLPAYVPRRAQAPTQKRTWSLGMLPEKTEAGAEAQTAVPAS